MDKCNDCDALKAQLLGLLARIHRDGGHHTEAVGLAQSVDDADRTVANWHVETDGWDAHVAVLKEQLAEAREMSSTCHAGCLAKDEVIGNLTRDVLSLRNQLAAAEAMLAEALPWVLRPSTPQFQPQALIDKMRAAIDRAKDQRDSA